MAARKQRGIITYQQSHYLALESEPASQWAFENRDLAAATKKNIQVAATKKKGK